MEKIKEAKNVGVRVSLLTALGNLLISIVYLAAGYFGQSISVISEGVDNLTDAGGSLLLLLGFKLSGRKADSRHPYGHGRAEYIVGLLISEIILFAAFSLGRESILRLSQPLPETSMWLILAVSAVGAAGKLGIAVLVKKANRKLNSSALKAYHKNALADLKGMAIVAVAAVAANLTAAPVDAYAGILLSLMILIDGVQALCENISLLLGQGPSVTQRMELENIVHSYDEFDRIESVEISDYGPGKKHGIIIAAAAPNRSAERLAAAAENCAKQIKARTEIDVTVYAASISSPTAVCSENIASVSLSAWLESVQRFSEYRRRAKCR